MEDESTGKELAEVAIAGRVDVRQLAALYDAGNIEGVKNTIAALPQGEFPVKHRFTKSIVGGSSRGTYGREIFMPAKSVILSKRHKTQHFFAVLQGSALVWTPGKPAEILEAGYVGITEPGTERLLEIIEDCRWITFHPTDETDLEKIEAEVIAKPGELIPLAPVEAAALEGSI